MPPQPPSTQPEAASDRQAHQARQAQGGGEANRATASKDARASSSPQKGAPTVIPALLLGDLFTPCNAIGLFQHNDELDKLLGTMGRKHDEPTQQRAGTHKSRPHHKSRAPHTATEPSEAPLKPTASATSPQADSGHVTSQADHAGSTHAQGNEGAPPPKRRVFLGKSRGQEGRGSDSRERGNGLSTAIDANVQLLVRTMLPVNSRRLFFVSPRAADTIREAVVLDRHQAIQKQKEAERLVAGPLAGLSGGDKTRGMTGWFGGMSDWLHGGSLGRGPLPFGLATTQQPHHRTDKGPPGSQIIADTGGGLGQGNGRNDSNDLEVLKRAQAATRQLPRSLRESVVGVDGGSGGEGGVIKAPHQVIPLVAQLVDVATQLGSAFDWRAMEERCVASEAKRILSGSRTDRGGTPTEGPQSFVGRVPLQAAFSLVSAAPNSFRFIVTGIDASLAQEARGRPSVLDLSAGPSHKWLFKVDEGSSDTDSTRQGSSAVTLQTEDSDGDTTDSEYDEDMALTSRTPVFHIPGLSLSLRTHTGQRVTFRPAFLSVAQLYELLEASQALARTYWVQKRRAQRVAFTRRLEAAALALSGLSGDVSGRGGSSLGSGAGGTAQSAGGGAGEGDEDENGWGELPESKALLAELGERRPMTGEGQTGINPGPVTGWPALLSTLAVGVVSATGHVATAVGNAWDTFTLQRSAGLQSIGFPKQVAVSADYLEPCLQSIAQDNAARMQRWRRRSRADPQAHPNTTLHTPIHTQDTPTPHNTESSTAQSQQGPQPHEQQGTGQMHDTKASGHGLVEPSNAQQQQNNGGGAMSDTPSQAAEGTVSRDSKDGGLGGGVDTVASQHVVGMEEGGGSTGAVPQRTRRRHQRSQRASRDAAAAAAVGDGLESLPGVNMLLQAAWAVLLDAQQGNARLASALAANWAPTSGNWPFTTDMSDKSSEEISVFMNVRLRAQPDNPFALDPTTTTPQQAPINTTNTHTDKATDSTQGGPGQAQGPGAPGPVLPLPGQGPSVAGQQPNVGVGVGLGMGSVGQQDPVTSVMGFAGQGTSGVLDGQSEQFEIGLHIHPGKVLGQVPSSEPDMASLDETSLKGLLVIGDLGLGTANPPASVQDWRAPALGYSDLAQYLAAYQTLHRDTSQNKSSSRR